MQKRNYFKILTIGTLLLFLIPALIFAVGTVRGGGILTAIESDGSVVIDDMVYLVSPSVNILGYDGERISLGQISPPKRVSFEYVYTSGGGMIVKLQLVDG